MLSVQLLATSLLLGVLLTSPASAQNALTRPVAPESGRDTSVLINGRYIFSSLNPFKGTMKIAWDSDTVNNAATELLHSWTGASFSTTLLRSCGSTTPRMECVAPVPDDLASFVNNIPGAQTIVLRDKGSLEPFAFSENSAPPVQVENSQGCQYAAPGVPIDQATHRDIGHSIQGENPIVTPSGQTQAQRIWQLRAWGYKVEWQHIGNSKLFLMAWCVGVPQN